MPVSTPGVPGVFGAALTCCVNRYRHRQKWFKRQNRIRIRSTVGCVDCGRERWGCRAVREHALDAAVCRGNDVVARSVHRLLEAQGSLQFKRLAVGNLLTANLHTLPSQLIDPDFHPFFLKSWLFLWENMIYDAGFPTIFLNNLIF